MKRGWGSLGFPSGSGTFEDKIYIQDLYLSLQGDQFERFQKTTDALIQSGITPGVIRPLIGKNTPTPQPKDPYRVLIREAQNPAHFFWPRLISIWWPKITFTVTWHQTKKKTHLPKSMFDVRKQTWLIRNFAEKVQTGISSAIWSFRETRAKSIYKKKMSWQFVRKYCVKKNVALCPYFGWTWTLLPIGTTTHVTVTKETFMGLFHCVNSCVFKRFQA